MAREELRSPQRRTPRGRLPTSQGSAGRRSLPGTRSDSSDRPFAPDRLGERPITAGAILRRKLVAPGRSVDRRRPSVEVIGDFVGELRVKSDELSGKHGHLGKLQALWQPKLGHACYP